MTTDNRGNTYLAARHRDGRNAIVIYDNRGAYVAAWAASTAEGEQGVKTAAVDANGQVYAPLRAAACMACRSSGESHETDQRPFLRLSARSAANSTRCAELERGPEETGTVARRARDRRKPERRRVRSPTPDFPVIQYTPDGKFLCESATVLVPVRDCFDPRGTPL
jgi:hypothetical protein